MSAFPSTISFAFNPTQTAGMSFFLALPLILFNGKVKNILLSGYFLLSFKIVRLGYFWLRLTIKLSDQAVYKSSRILFKSLYKSSSFSFFLNFDSLILSKSLMVFDNSAIWE